MGEVEPQTLQLRFLSALSPALGSPGKLLVNHPEISFFVSQESLEWKSAPGYSLEQWGRESPFSY